MNIRKSKEFILRLVKQNSTPEGIALGVSIGVFIGVLPLYGLHTLIVIVAVILIPRVNKVAVFIGTSISLPPTIPFITWAGYEIGRFLFHKDHSALSFSYFKHIKTFKDFGDFYFPLFLGSIVLGVICAIIFYFITYYFVRKLKDGKEHV